MRKSGQSLQAKAVPPAAPASDRPHEELARAAFLASIGTVLVEPPVYHRFSGAIDVEHATAIWNWIARDIAAEEVARLADAIDSGAEPGNALDAILPDIIERLRLNAKEEETDSELARRNAVQVGGEEIRKRLPHIIMALRRRPLLAQAASFGKAIGTLQDEETIAQALSSVNIANPVTKALWMQAMVGHIANPSRILAAVTEAIGGNDEVRVTNAGYAPLVEAILSHAQSQIGRLDSEPRVFSDMDMACKAIDRYHRLMRAINHNLEIERKSYWGVIVTDLVARISERLTRPIRQVNVDVTQALRKPREGADRIDPEAVLAALNGLYLLTTARRARDSLAVNAVLDQAWNDTGQTVEVLVTRTIDLYKADRGDPVARERAEAGLKMAEIRLSPEYADILRRSFQGGDRRDQVETG